MTETISTENLHRGQVSLDGKDLFNVWIRSDLYWNGWANPYLTHEQCEQVKAWADADPDAWPSVEYDKDRDAWVILDLDSDYEDLCVGIMIQGEKLYPFGHCSWTWWDHSIQ